ncbi:MAG: hypothetical protein R3263_00255 [Myxococcota bacterium]|nr:hypothetical protein [Myxococcota bacterium]
MRERAHRLAARTARRLLPAGAVAAALVAAPRAAEACAVCFSGRTDETRIAFILTTAFLTVMPFVLIGAAAVWLRRRLREHEAAQDAHRVRDAARGAGGGSPLRRVAQG